VRGPPPRRRKAASRIFHDVAWPARHEPLQILALDKLHHDRTAGRFAVLEESREHALLLMLPRDRDNRNMNCAVDAPQARLGTLAAQHTHIVLTTSDRLLEPPVEPVVQSVVNHASRALAAILSLRDGDAVMRLILSRKSGRTTRRSHSAASPKAPTFARRGFCLAARRRPVVFQAMGRGTAAMSDGPVAVRFEFKTEADAIAVADQLRADGLAIAVEIRTADGRAHEFDAYRAELEAKQQTGGRPLGHG
jgi:hypothetical protein